MKLTPFTTIGLLCVAQLLPGSTPYWQWLKPVPSAHAESPVMTLRWEQTDVNANKIEASGILWDAGAEHFLVVSDETYQKQPGVFVLEKNGDFRAILSMQKSTSIDDLESISTDGHFIYILNSFSDKKINTGKLIRFKYQHDAVTEQQEVNLLEVLTKIVNDQPTSRLANLLSKTLKKQDVDVEAHLVLNNTLYLAFNTPLEKARDTVFVKFNHLADIFAGRPTSAEIVLTLTLPSPETGKPTLLSDMTLVGTDLFLLSVEKGASKDSYLWRYTLGEDKPNLVKAFSGIQAEGITYFSGLSFLIVVFDEGNGNPSKYQVFNLAEL
jgi:hypothetical protein